MPAPPDLPLVTVVIPTWNRLPLLRQAVASVVAQTYPRWELVVADDGSTDGTPEWVRSLHDPRIRVVGAPHTGHVGRARNVGVAAGSGELVAFLDSDDVWLPPKLEMQVAALRETGARWSYTAYELMDDDGRTVPRRAGTFRPLAGRIARQVVGMEADVSVCTLVVDRALFERIGRFSEDPRLVSREDYELEMRLGRAGDAVAVPEILVRVREHPGRTTSSVRDAFELLAVAYERFLETEPPAELARLARRMRANALADAGAQRLARGEYAAATRLFARSLGGGPSARSWARALARGVRDRLREPAAGEAPASASPR